MRLRDAILLVLRRARHDRGWTLAEVADRAHLSEMTVSRVFRGRTWSIDSVQSIAAALDVEDAIVSGLVEVAGPND